MHGGIVLAIVGRIRLSVYSEPLATKSSDMKADLNFWPDPEVFDPVIGRPDPIDLVAVTAERRKYWGQKA